VLERPSRLSSDTHMLRYYGSGSKSFPSPANTFVLGPCTGGFAAAAISCSQSLADVIPNGIEATIAAFKTALCSFLVGRSLSRVQAMQPKSWSVALNVPKDVEIEDMLREYTPVQVRITCNSAHVCSSHAPGTVPISQSASLG
jgi:hypothetical protein